MASKNGGKSHHADKLGAKAAGLQSGGPLLIVLTYSRFPSQFEKNSFKQRKNLKPYIVFLLFSGLGTKNIYL